MVETIIGGILVLFGVVVTQIVNTLTSHKDRVERRRKLLREKYEELCQSVLATTTELQQVMKLGGQEALTSSPPSSPQRAHYLAMIYFPELRKLTREYNNAIVLLYMFSIQHFDPRLPIPLGSQATNFTEYLSYQDNMIDKRTELEHAIEVNADIYTMA